MSAAQIRLPGASQGGPLEGHPRRWSWRAIAVVALVALAYNYSLFTLVRGLTLQTPLGYLAFVPALALALAWVRLAREPAVRPIHDRQLDYIVGLAFIGGAVAIVTLAPANLTTRFWLERIDLLSLPLFVAGLVALLYGVRRLWALKAPIAFLLLAWPVPYQAIFADQIGGFAAATTSVVARLSSFVPTAHPVPGDDSLFVVGQGANAFVVGIGSACAGVNSLVGYALIGIALAYVVRGSALRRGAWLAVGLGAIWLLNVVRIETIFLGGDVFGHEVALDVLHPLVGLVFFNAGLVLMLLVAPAFGLAFVDIGHPRPGGPLVTPSPVRRIRAPILLGLGITAAMALVNAGFVRYETIAGDLGSARLTPFDVRTAQVSGWTSALVASYDDLARQFFGSAATWDRLLYSSNPGAALSASVPLYVDVMNTQDPGTFAAHGLAACYGFHGYRVEAETDAGLGAGLTGQVIDYTNVQAGGDWSALVWEWPYHDTAGRTWFERVVIFVANGPRATYVGGVSEGLVATASRFEATDRFLVALGRAIVQGQVGRAQP